MAKPLKPYEITSNTAAARKMTGYRGWDVRTEAGRKRKELLDKRRKEEKNEKLPET